MSNDRQKKKSDANKPMVAARHENSVLFTLSDLGATAGSATRRENRASIPIQNEDEDASGYINLGHAAGIGAAASAAKSGGGNLGDAGDDASGFINIGALSNLNSAGASGANAASGDGAAPAAAAPMMPGAIPMGRAGDDNTIIKAAIAISLLLLIVALGGLAFVLYERSNQSAESLVKEVPAEAQPAAGAPAPDGEGQGAAPVAKDEEGEDEEAEGEEEEEGAEDEEEAVAEVEDAEAADGEGEKVADAKAAGGAKKVKKPRDAKAGAAATGKTSKATAKEEPKSEDAVAARTPEGDQAKTPKADKAPAAQPKDNMDNILAELGAPKEEKKPDLPKSLTRAQVKSVVAGQRGRVMGCGGAGRSGTVIVRFTIMPSGAIGGASVANDKRGTPEGNCVAGVVRSMRFPAFNGSSMTISYPFVLP